MYSLLSSDYAPDAFEVRVSELLVATAEGGDALISSAVSEVLHLLGEKLGMDVVFVSEFVDGHRVYRHVEADADKRIVEEDDPDPLEHTFCQRVVDGRLPRMVRNFATDPATQGLPTSAPFPIGSYLSVPVVLGDGCVYGTLCCFSFADNEALTHRDLKKLELSAQLTARRIDEVRSREASGGDLSAASRRAH